MSLQKRMEGIFLNIFKRTVLPKLKDVILKWGQAGLDKAVNENIPMLQLIQDKDPNTYKAFSSFKTKLSPLRRYMYKWDNKWNASVLIKVLEKDGMEFDFLAERWLVQQLDELKKLVYGDNNVKNQQFLHARYITKTVPDSTDEILKQI